MSEELKSCPFCGGNGTRKIIKPYRKIKGRGQSYLAIIGCETIGCTAEVSQAGFTREDAWKYAEDRWNKREAKLSYKVITLCGSTKFKEEFIEQQKRLTLDGNIVISVGLFGHSGDTFTEEQKVMLDDMHKRKIDMADEIFVIDVNGYIGNSTRSEIEYAKANRKKVNYYTEWLEKTYS
jgi:hypothetical protein